jgi:hypothetical protein
MKTCDGCTKCCEGWLTGKVFGEEFYPGKPCKFVKAGIGCTVYDSRPANPCRVFDCFWKIDEDMPDSLHPNVSNGIVHRKIIGGISVVSITHTGHHIAKDLIDYMTVYAINNGVNLVVNDTDTAYVAHGSNSFRQLFDIAKKGNMV